LKSIVTVRRFAISFQLTPSPRANASQYGEVDRHENVVHRRKIHLGMKETLLIHTWNFAEYLKPKMRKYQMRVCGERDQIEGGCYSMVLLLPLGENGLDCSRFKRTLSLALESNHV
jgi:hypothetical protein